jgi:protein SCO1/2
LSRSPLFLARVARIALPVLLAASGSMSAVQAQLSPPPPTQLPPQLTGVGYDQRLGDRLPLGLAFQDETGKAVRLATYFRHRPVVFALAYYSCPMLCTVVLDDLASTLKAVGLTPGKDFDVVVASFDPRDTPGAAAETKNKVVARYGNAATAPAWHFLTGREESIRQLTRAIGFRYQWDEKTGQFAHAAGVVVLTPEGRISRYFYGIDYPPRDVRLGLVEAASRRIGTVSDRLLLFCFHYDPAVGKYSAATFNILRVAAALTLFGLVSMIVILRRREINSLRAA